MSESGNCDRFRECVREVLSVEGKCYTLPEKEKGFLHKHAVKCKACREWGREFTSIPLSREQEDFLSEVYRQERRLAPILFWSFWCAGVLGGVALLCGVFFYLEERMSTELAPGVKMERFSSPAEYKKKALQEKRLFEQRKQKEALRKKRAASEILPEKVEYATIAFPMGLFRNRDPEKFFRGHLGDCRIYMMEKDPSGKMLLVHVPGREAKRFSELKKRLLKKGKPRKK